MQLSEYHHCFAAAYRELQDTDSRHFLNDKGAFVCRPAGVNSMKLSCTKKGDYSKGDRQVGARKKI